jgi:Holliday junction resolvasome RuvABC endonuclease subunit
MIKVLAIDPAYSKTGWICGIIDCKEGLINLSLVDSGIVSTEKSKPSRGIRVADDTILRCQTWISNFKDILATHSPDLIAAELPSAGGKSASAIKAMAIATALVGSISLGKAGDFFTPLEVKKALTGDKNASKDAMCAAAIEIFPELGKYASARSSSGFRGMFEHIADAVGVLKASSDGALVRGILSVSK